MFIEIIVIKNVEPHRDEIFANQNQESADEQVVGRRDIGGGFIKASQRQALIVHNGKGHRVPPGGLW